MHKQAKYWVQRVAKADESMGVSQLLGSTCPGSPKSTPMHVLTA